MIVHVEHNISWVPQPNKVEIVLSDELCPRELTATAFVVPLFDNGDVLMAQNRARGVEIPGGHVEEGESLEDAARREALGEVGCEITDLVPIGFQRITSEAKIPPGYRYPHPLGYQQFFAAKIVSLGRSGDFECGEPVRKDVAAKHQRASVNILVARAREVLL